MKNILRRLFNYEHLGKAEAQEVLIDIADEKYPPAQVAAFITVYLMRPILLHELEGFQQALLDLARPVDLEGLDAIDLCGTGGDGKNTFNISTLAAIVVAGAGYHVCKHGNYGVSSVCGSSNVLEHLGYRFVNDQDTIKRQLDKHKLCFLHAPLFHPAMKSVAPIRKELAVKTFFNMLGPLVNPASPPYQYTGVFNPNIGRLYHYTMERSERINYAVVHSHDGYDEISLTGSFQLLSRNEQRILDPAQIGFEPVAADHIFGGTSVNDCAALFLDILGGKGSKQQSDVVIANAGMAIHCMEPERTYRECMGLASESLQSGKALKNFTSLISMSSS
jgi:anthranilate phosphoribosyltransferase